MTKSISLLILIYANIFLISFCRATTTIEKFSTTRILEIINHSLLEQRFFPRFDDEFLQEILEDIIYCFKKNVTQRAILTNDLKLALIAFLQNSIKLSAQDEYRYNVNIPLMRLILLKQHFTEVSPLVEKLFNIKYLQDLYSDQLPPNFKFEKVYESLMIENNDYVADHNLNSHHLENAENKIDILRQYFEILKTVDLDIFEKITPSRQGVFCGAREFSFFHRLMTKYPFCYFSRWQTAKARHTSRLRVFLKNDQLIVSSFFEPLDEIVTGKAFYCQNLDTLIWPIDVFFDLLLNVSTLLGSAKICLVNNNLFVNQRFSVAQTIFQTLQKMVEIQAFIASNDLVHAEGSDEYGYINICTQKSRLVSKFYSAEKIAQLINQVLRPDMLNWFCKLLAQNGVRLTTLSGRAYSERKI